MHRPGEVRGGSSYTAAGWADKPAAAETALTGKDPAAELAHTICRDRGQDGARVAAPPRSAGGPSKSLSREDRGEDADEDLQPLRYAQPKPALAQHNVCVQQG